MVLSWILVIFVVWTNNNILNSDSTSEWWFKMLMIIFILQLPWYTLVIIVIVWIQVPNWYSFIESSFAFLIIVYKMSVVAITNSFQLQSLPGQGVTRICFEDRNLNTYTPLQNWENRNSKDPHKKDASCWALGVDGLLRHGSRAYC